MPSSSILHLLYIKPCFIADVLVFSLRGRPESQTSFLSCLNLKVAPKIKALMMETGTTMVGYQPQGEKVNFFRMVISNPAASQSDIDFLIEEIERLGQDL